MPPVEDDDKKKSSTPSSDTPTDDPGGQGDGGDGGDGSGSQTPTNKGSQKKPGASDGGSDDDQGSPGGKVEDLPEWAQKQIKDLRSENAKTRTKAKTLEDRVGKIEKGFKSMFGNEEGDDDLPPEEKLAKVQAQSEASAARAEMLEFCMENGITEKRTQRYLSVLIDEASEELEDGEELSDERLEELIQEAKSVGGRKKASSSVDGKGSGKKPPNPEGDSGVSLEQFNNMGALDRNKLYRENPDLYNRLSAEAKERGTFVR